MANKKIIKLENLHIGDIVVLRNGSTAIIVKLQSISYINYLKSKSKLYKTNENKNNLYIYDTITVYVNGHNKIITIEEDDIIDILDNKKELTDDIKVNKFKYYFDRIMRLLN